MTTLAKLEALLAAATPGPWSISPEGRGTRVEAPPRDSQGLQMVSLCRHIAPGRGSRENAELVVALRNAAPDLLAVVRAAQEVADSYPEGVEKSYDPSNHGDSYAQGGDETGLWIANKLRAALAKFGEAP